MSVRKPNKMTRGLNTFSLLSITISIIILVIIIGIHIYPYRLLEVEDPVKILTPLIRSGEHVKYETSFCKYTNLNGMVSKKLIDDYVYVTAPKMVSSDKGCQTIQGFMEIPKYMPSGMYKIGFTVEYQVNFFKTITIKYYSEDFNIINEKD